VSAKPNVIATAGGFFFHAVATRRQPFPGEGGLDVRRGIIHLNTLKNKELTFQTPFSCSLKPVFWPLRGGGFSPVFHCAERGFH
jgi:hypothetical protein